jgi:hypothetical protein
LNQTKIERKTSPGFHPLADAFVSQKKQLQIIIKHCQPIKTFLTPTIKNKTKLESLTPQTPENHCYEK